MDVNKFILSNVSVEFPFRPYPCQVVYMEKVIQALQQASAARLLMACATIQNIQCCMLCCHKYDNFFDHFNIIKN
jgi:hypothetical protein